MKKIATTILLSLSLAGGLWAQKPISSWNNNQVVAHRGAWKAKGLPENSIASLKEAIRMKCHGSEFDVHLTADSVLVVNHDPVFMGMPIAQSTYAQLLTKKHPNGESIPTAEAYLRAGKKQKGTKLILEIKLQNMGAEHDLYLTQRCLDLVRQLKCEAWVEYISFGYNVCQYLVAHAPGAPVQYLNGDVPPEKLQADHISGIDYHYSVFLKNDWVAPAKKLGITLNAWTVNEAADMDRLLGQGFDYITTNEPGLLFERIKAQGK